MNKCLRVAVVAFVASACLAAEPEAEKKPSFWMKKKLEYSESILVGLANGDYDSIGKTARSMNTLTQMEKWVCAACPSIDAVADFPERQPADDPDGR